MNIEWIGKKSRGRDNPYAVFSGTMFGGPATFSVLKKYKNDDATDYAAWFIVAVTVATGELGDMGDTYIRDVVPYLNLTEVDGREPTDAELADVETLRMEVMAQPAHPSDWF